MPTPTPPPTPDSPGMKRGFHLPGRQPYARQIVRRQHEEALLAFGELSLFVLMWGMDDLAAGLVGRCSRCSTIAGETAEAAEMVFSAFQSTAEANCPVCFGTTLEGGWKAKLVRPAIWDYSEEVWSRTERGMVKNYDGSVQTTADFMLRDGDYIFRGDGTRWKSKGGSTNRIHDGFGLPSRADSNLGYNYSSVTMDQDGDAANIPPLTRTELTAMLDVVGKHFLPEIPDEIRGPVLPEAPGFVPADYRPIDNLPGSPHAAP